MSTVRFCKGTLSPFWLHDYMILVNCLFRVNLMAARRLRKSFSVLVRQATSYIQNALRSMTCLSATDLYVISCTGRKSSSGLNLLNTRRASAELRRCFFGRISPSWTWVTSHSSCQTALRLRIGTVSKNVQPSVDSNYNSEKVLGLAIKCQCQCQI